MRPLFCKMINTNRLGYHIIADLYGCNPSVIDNLHLIKDLLKHAVEFACMNSLGEIFHKFEPNGVTGIVALEESHISIHTWPEIGYVAIDVFTCGDKAKPHIALQIICDSLNPTRTEIRELERGCSYGVLDS